MLKHLFILNGIFIATYTALFPTTARALDEPCGSYLAMSKQSPLNGDYPYAKVNVGSSEQYYCAGLVEQSQSSLDGLLVSYFLTTTKISGSIPLPAAIGVSSTGIATEGDVHVTLMSNSNGFRVDSELSFDTQVSLKADSFPEGITFDLATTQLVGRLKFNGKTVFFPAELIREANQGGEAEVSTVHLAIAGTSTAARIIVFSGQWHPDTDRPKCGDFGGSALLDEAMEALEFKAIGFERDGSTAFCLRIFRQLTPTSEIESHDYFFF